MYERPKMRAKNAKMHLSQEMNVSSKWFSKDYHKPRMVGFKRKPQRI